MTNNNIGSLNYKTYRLTANETTNHDYKPITNLLQVATHKPQLQTKCKLHTYYKRAATTILTSSLPVVQFQQE